MNAPTCLWSPMDGQALQQEMRQWRRPAQRSSDREQRSGPQGRYAADVMDSFRMNLRQAKHALVIRDEEARKLRLAVTHLEGVLSLRERELQDTVLCLHGKSDPRPHQEWLQPGTSNSRLRLQVHRLQRVLTAKQDHIEHLNRQASLGFLREAREQADEYRIEAARLSRALAAATGGAGRRGQFATRTPVDCLLSSDSRGAGAASTTLGFRVEESKNQGARASQEPDLSGALYARVPQFRSQNMSRSAQRCDVRRDVHQQQRSFDGSYGGRKASPALDVEATIHANLGGHGAVRGREMPPAPCLPPPLTTLDDVETGLLFVPPPPRNNDGVHGLIHSGRRPTSSRRSAGRASARAGYGRFRGWSASPDRCRAFSEEKRLSCMAASARLRSAVRRSALEHNDVLALSEESRRLQMARAERARRARMARQRIARYREERIRELERRLDRHCGTQSAHPAPATDTAEPPGAQQHKSKRTGKDRHGHESGGEDTNTSAGTTDGGKLQRLSEARREIDAAIATAMEEKYGPAIAHHEPTGSAKTKVKDSQDGDFVNRQRQWRRSSSGTGSVTAEDDPIGRGAQEDTHDLRTRQSGKPPLAPSHPGRRRRPQSALRRHSSVSEVAESEDASSDDEIGGGDHVREVQTEAVGNGGDDGGSEDRWHDQHLPDEEESVQEEIVPARGWGEDERGGAPVDGVPPTLSKVGNERARRRLNDDHKRRRNPHYERNDEVIGENNDKREEGVPALDAVCENVNGRDYLGSGRTKLTTRKSLPITERRDRRSSPRGDELDLRREAAEFGGLFDKNTKPRARKREGGGSSNDSRQDSAGGSVEGAQNNLRSRGRRRRRRDEGGKVRIDSGRFDDPVPPHGHTLTATIGATVASEIREETDIVDGGMEDDRDSCSSRWSLSAENEPQESQSADSASPTRQAQHVVGGGSGGSSPTRIANPDGERDRYDRQRKASVEPEFEDGATSSGSGNHAGGVIPEYTDDFSEESQRRDQGFDVVYGVSSPSDEEHEAFAEAKADCDTQVRNAHQRGRLQPTFDTNTASNQRMINEPPFELPTTDTRQDDSSSVGGNERTGRLRPDNNNSSDENQGLLQPVSPPVLRHRVQTAEFGGALAECPFPEREQQARRTQPSVREPVATKVDDKAGTNNLSSAHSVEQASTLRSHDTLNAGQSEMESGSEGNDIVASLKIDSAALFASLSASTAGVSLSSKSMARPEESRVNVQGVAAPVKQPGGSTSTFALSADDGDDAGTTHVEDDDATATKSSSARIEMERASIAGNSRGLNGDESNEEDSSTVRRQVAPPTSVSPTSSLERGDDGTTTVPEIGERLDSLPVVEQQQTSPSREVSSGAPHRNGVILPTQQVYDTATASVTELAASPMGDRTTLLLGDEEAEQPQVRGHLDLEDIARRQDEDEGASIRPLHDRSRVDEDSDGGLERDAETRPAFLLGGEDRLSGDDGGGIAAAAASERPPSGGEDSSHSNCSLLDAGGGGVDDDDDDGYF